MINLHHGKYLKYQQRNRKLVEVVIDLINCNDHNSLASLARSVGIPPQLRHVVWPILLKYHPMCISPNIISNVYTWDSVENAYCLLENGSSGNSQEDLERLIVNDLKKYFHLRHNNNSFKNNNATKTASSSEISTVCSMDLLSLNLEDELDILESLKLALLKFLKKWSKVFRYESGLSWIATGLAEWVPVNGTDSTHEEKSDIDGEDEGPVILNGKKHTHSPCHSPPYSYSNVGSGYNNTCLSYLYKEYPLPACLRSKLPKSSPFTFDEIYERLVLVIMHCPDTVLAQTQLRKESLTKSENGLAQDKKPSSVMNYFPVLSGGDLSFQTQVFFRVFSTILPELYQPFTEESVLQPSSKRTSWLYWWIKCSGARALQRQDRGRLWDILLGWRPEPNMEAIDFFLDYNTKKFDHFYNKVPKMHEEFITSLVKNDPFWFPDLDTIPMGSDKFKFDYNIFKEILRRNQYDQSAGEKTESYESNENELTFSLIDPHMQLVFIYIAILQYNEFKLLEFEETETSEFLNHVPMLSKADDVCYRKLYELTVCTDSSVTNSQEDLHKRPNSSSMRIEVGNDAKASHSFNDLLDMAGDIWRKWLWNELQDSSISV